MKTLSTIVLCIAAVLSFTVSAKATQSDIQPFYDFLSNPSSQSHADALTSSLAASWKSIGDYSGHSKSADKFVKQVKGFGKLIPDLNWAIEEVVIQGNKVVVRSRATGTPKGSLFGVDGQGKSFDILTIDIHTVENGAITETYHVEDWAGALRQLKAK